MKCFECNGQYKKTEYDYSMYGTKLCKVKALVCNKCGDTVFNDTAQAKIEEAAKKKDLWGLESRSKIGRVGNSLDVKISKRLAEFLGVKKGDSVSVYPDSNKRFIVEINGV